MHILSDGMGYLGSCVDVLVDLFVFNFLVHEVSVCLQVEYRVTNLIPRLESSSKIVFILNVVYFIC